MTVDLLIGSDIGRWSLQHVRPSEVGALYSRDNELLRMGSDLGFVVESARPQSPTALSVHYGAILTSSRLAEYEAAYNLHPGFLPWGRGYFPVFWAIWANEPAGATLHQMTEVVDSGPIVERRSVDLFPDDTGYSVHERVRSAERELFLTWWPRLVTGVRPSTLPQEGGGSHHARVEFERLRDQADWSSLSAEDLARLVRALTFPGLPGLRLWPSPVRLTASQEGASDAD